MRKRIVSYGTTVLSAMAPSVAPGWASAGKTSKISRIGVGRFLAVVLLGLTVMGVQPAAAQTTWYVATTGSDANNCTTPAMPCQTIQAAINKASAGDTINVAAGAYPEAAGGPLKVDKTLILLGAQNGVDARGRVAAESIVTDSSGTWIDANNVVIDGFTIQDSTNQFFTGYGIWMGGKSGAQILNNIIQSNIVGIGLSNPPGGSQALIRHNQIQNNNQAGGASGDGIYTDQFVSGGAVNNVLVQENAFSGNNTAGIDVSNTDAANGVSNLDISTNSFDTNGRAVLLFNTHMSTIHNNSITNSTAGGSAAIRLLDNNTNLTILNNDLSNGAGHAIRLSDLNFVDPANPNPSSGLEIHQNNIEVFGLTGLTVDAGSHVGTVDAECNWWNSASGPTNPNNPGGTGEEVVGDADFTPWLIGPAPGGPCLGGEPPPENVTGGGQIDVPGGRGSFGFNAKPETQNGHLNYLNHATGARLSCTITAVTVISSAEAEFSGTTCSANSSATSFTAHVEDNGEPGKNVDHFEIMYNTTTEGNTIDRGNIQVQ